MQKSAKIEEAWGRKYPEPVVLVITKNDEGRVNLMTVAWICIASDEPPMFLLGIDGDAYTLELIRKNREFVVAYPSEGMAYATLYAGTAHGNQEDKGTLSGLKFVTGTIVDVPILEDAVANFECRLIEITRPGNCPIVLGEIVFSHENSDESVKRLYNLAKGYRLGGVIPKKDAE